MIPTVGFNMRKITKGNVTIKVRIWENMFIILIVRLFAALGYRRTAAFSIDVGTVWHLFVYLIAFLVDIVAVWMRSYLWSTLPIMTNLSRRVTSCYSCSIRRNSKAFPCSCSAIRKIYRMHSTRNSWSNECESGYTWYSLIIKTLF